MSVNNGSSVYNQGLTDADVKNIVDNLPEFQAKADANKVVAISDAYVKRNGAVTNYWYKIADTSYRALNNFRCGIWNIIYVKSYAKIHYGDLCFLLQTGGLDVPATILQAECYYDYWTSVDSKMKFVLRGVSGQLNIELWVMCDNARSGFNLSEKNSSGFSVSQEKSIWNYYRYENQEGSPEPVTDSDNNIYVTDVTMTPRIHTV